MKKITFERIPISLNLNGETSNDLPLDESSNKLSGPINLLHPLNTFQRNIGECCQMYQNVQRNTSNSVVKDAIQPNKETASITPISLIVPGKVSSNWNFLDCPSMSQYLNGNETKIKTNIKESKNLKFLKTNKQLFRKHFGGCFYQRNLPEKNKKQINFNTNGWLSEKNLNQNMSNEFYLSSTSGCQNNLNSIKNKKRAVKSTLMAKSFENHKNHCSNNIYLLNRSQTKNMSNNYEYAFKNEIDKYPKNLKQIEEINANFKSVPSEKLNNKIFPQQSKNISHCQQGIDERLFFPPKSFSGESILSKKSLLPQSKKPITKTLSTDIFCTYSCSKMFFTKDITSTTSYLSFENISDDISISEIADEILLHEKSKSGQVLFSPEETLHQFTNDKMKFPSTDNPLVGDSDSDMECLLPIEKEKSYFSWLNPFNFVKRLFRFS